MHRTTHSRRLLTVVLAGAALVSGVSAPAALAQGVPYLVKDINSGPVTNVGSDPTSFTQAGGTMFFVANDTAHGSELWKTDALRPARCWSRTSTPDHRAPRQPR